MLSLPLINFLRVCFRLQQNQQNRQFGHPLQKSLAVRTGILHLHERIFNSHDLDGLHAVLAQQGKQYHGDHVRGYLLVTGEQQENEIDRKVNFGWVRSHSDEHR